MGKVKEKFLSLPLKRAFILLVMTMAVLVAGISAMTIFCCSNLQQRLLEEVKVPLTSIVDPDLGVSDDPNEIVGYQQVIIIDSDGIETDKNGQMFVVSLETRMENMTAQNRLTYRAAGAAMIAVPCLLFVIGTFFCAWVFYSLKLKKPLNLLLDAAGRISKNELDFTMDYKSSDEMGTLVSGMDSMRDALARNNQVMWNMMEERRKLNASIAHDLRTPLTVMKGYTEFLTRNIPLGRVSETKLLSTVESLSQATERMESYVNQVRDLQALDAVPVEIAPASLSEYFGQLETAYTALAQQQHIRFEMDEIPAERVLLDEKLLSRMLDNAVSNAIRYAKKSITMGVSWKDDMLTVTVQDDGPGFSAKALSCAAKSFYKENSQNDHYGLGLAICDTLCRKLGGALALRNNDNGGACVEITIRAALEK